MKHCHSLETLRCGGCPRSDNNNIDLKVVPSESSNIGTKQCDNNNNNNSFKQKMEEKVSKVVTKCQSPSSTLDYNNSLGAFNGISYPTDLVLKDKFTDSIKPVFTEIHLFRTNKRRILV